MTKPPHVPNLPLLVSLDVILTLLSVLVFSFINNSPGSCIYLLHMQPHNGVLVTPTSI